MVQDFDVEAQEATLPNAKCPFHRKPGLGLGCVLAADDEIHSDFCI